MPDTTDRSSVAMRSPVADRSSVDGDGLDELAVEVVTALRRSGVTVPTGSTVAYARALGAVGASARGVYWAGRATLVRRPEDVAAYDRVFGEVVGRPPVRTSRSRPVDSLYLDDPVRPRLRCGAANPEVQTVRWIPPRCCATRTSPVHARRVAGRTAYRRLRVGLRRPTGLAVGAPVGGPRRLGQVRPRCARGGGAARAPPRPATSRAGSCSWSTSAARWRPTPAR